MIQYPLTFDVNGSASPGMKESWCSTGNGKEVTLAVPECFDGSGSGLSPEDLYAMSLLNCFLGTFKVYAEKSRMEFDKVAGKAQLFVDRNENGMPWMKRIEFKLDLFNPSDTKKAEKLIGRVFKSGMILNSVKTEITYSWTMHARQDVSSEETRASA